MESEAPRPSQTKPQTPHENLGKRVQIIDLLTAVLMGGLVVTLLSASDPENAAILSILWFALSLAAVWWSATVANTYDIKTLWKRVVLHVYAFFSFLSSVAFVGAVVALVERLLNEPDVSACLVLLSVLFASAAITTSMLVIERRRIQTSKEQAEALQLKQSACSVPTNTAAQLIQTETR